MGKSRFEGAKRGPNPTDRAKMGTKKSVLVDEEGGPLAAVIDGANVHDTKLLADDDQRSSDPPSRPCNGYAEPLPGQGV